MVNNTNIFLFTMTLILILTMVVDRGYYRLASTSAQINTNNTVGTNNTANMISSNSVNASKKVSGQYLITLNSTIISDTQRERIIQIISDRITKQGIEVVNIYPAVGILVIKLSNTKIVDNILKELQRDLKVKISIEQDREVKTL
jgi:hypothetical protein